MEYIVIFLICTFSGFLTGLLGIGGGIIIVPLFLFILPFFNLTFSLQEIIGISATCVFLNSATATFYRRKEKSLPFNNLLPLVVSIIIGTILGSYFSDFAPKTIILGIYVLVCLFSIYVINGSVYFDLRKNNLHFLIYFLFAGIGAISASIGIGGAALFTPALKCFYGKDTKELIPVVTKLVFFHALFAFLSKFILGHITLIIIPIAFVSSIVGSKIGIIISKKLTSTTLSKILSVVLVLGLIKIIFEFFVK